MEIIGKCVFDEELENELFSKIGYKNMFISLLDGSKETTLKVLERFIKKEGKLR
jgi:hypothetical protein